MQVKWRSTKVVPYVVKANLSETEKYRLEDEEVIPQLSCVPRLRITFPY